MRKSRRTVKLVVQTHSDYTHITIQARKDRGGVNPETNERSLKEPTCVSKAHGGSHLHFPLQAPSRNTLKRSGNENVNGNAGNLTSYRIATKVPSLVTRDEARRAG